MARGGNKLRLNNVASAHGEQDFGLDPAQVQPCAQTCLNSRIQRL